MNRAILNNIYFLNSFHVLWSIMITELEYWSLISISARCIVYCVTLSHCSSFSVLFIDRQKGRVDGHYLRLLGINIIYFKDTKNDNRLVFLFGGITHIIFMYLIHSMTNQLHILFFTTLNIEWKRLKEISFIKI